MSNATVYVSGVPASAAEDDLVDFFSRIGNVAEVRMPAAGSQQPIAVVFESPEDAMSAVSISGSDYQDGIPIRVSAAAPAGTADAAAAATAAAPASGAAAAEANAATAEKGREGSNATGDEEGDDDGSASAASDRAEAEKDASPTSGLTGAALAAKYSNNIVVESIAPYTTRGAFQELFMSCGPTSDYNFLRLTHRAYITYRTAEGFEKALKLNGTMLNGKALSVRPRMKLEDGRRDRPDRREDRDRREGKSEGRLRLSSVPLNQRVVVWAPPKVLTRDNITNFFHGKCGKIVDYHRVPNADCAFIAFTSPENARRAVAMSGQAFMGVNVRVEVREPLTCRRCKKEGHIAAQCSEPRSTRGRSGADRGERRRRRRSSSSYSSASSDREYRRSRRRRHSSESPDRDRDRERGHRRRSRSRSPARRRRHSRSRSPPRDRRR